MLFPGGVSGLLDRYSNVTDPTDFPFPGTQITPGNNTFPTPVEILDGSVVLTDCFWVTVNINTVFVSTQAKDLMVDIMYDPAGGTSWQTLIPSLLGTQASDWNMVSNGGAHGGHWYSFPLYIPAGSSIGASASVNNGTVGTARVWVQLFGNAVRPELHKVGYEVEAVGAVRESSRGTLVTPGVNGADGSWTSLGTTTDACWYWEIGMSGNDGTIAVGHQFADIAAGSSQDMLIPRAYFNSTSAEARNKWPVMCNQYHEVQAGETIYGRIANSLATNDSNYGLIAYGVKG